MIFFARKRRVAQAIQDQWRYIVFNVAVWLLVAGVAAASLALTRRFGTAVTARNEAGHEIEAGRLLIGDGNVFEGQRHLIRALEIHPRAAGRLVRLVDRQLVGLPYLREALDGLVTQHGPPALQARLALFSGDEAGAQAGYARALARGGTASAEASLALGRMALREGRFEEAKAHFKAYWAAPPQTKDELKAQVFPKGDLSARDYHRAGVRFMECGLRDDAWLAFNESRKAEGDFPDLRFYEALSLELKGDLKEAVRVYSDLAAQFPEHRRGLERLLALAMAEPAIPEDMTPANGESGG